LTRNPFLLFIGGISSLIVAMGIGRFAYTPILPIMQNALSFSNALAGYLATSNYAGYFLGAFFAGMIGSKKKRMITLKLSLIVSVLSTLFMGLSHSYPLMFILRFLSGLSSAFIFIISSSIVLDELASKNKSSWSGFFYGGIGIGIVLSSLAIPYLNDFFHWEGSWIGLGLLSGILAIFVWIWLKPSEDGLDKKEQQDTSTPVPSKKYLPWLTVAYGFEGLGYIVTGTFIVSIAEETSTFSSDPTYIWMLVGLAAIPSCMIWSYLAKKQGFVRALVFSIILQSIGIVIPVFWVSPISLIISALLFGSTFIGIVTLSTTLAGLISPTNRNRVIGILTTFYAIGQMIGPSIAGVLATITGNFHISLIVAAGTTLLGAFLLIGGILFERKLNKVNSPVISED
jgi:predicted MFS family arabinose efflux permease